MPTTNASRLAELKRAGYPFNPTRPSNWFSGILQTLQARNRPTHRIDLLAEDTLKQMEIVTRGSRREFILKQVEKAILKLCSLNVLRPYGSSRVEIWPDLASAKLDRHLKAGPLPWDEETSNAGTGDNDDAGSDAEIDDALKAHDDGNEVAGGQIDGGSVSDLPPSPPKLPPIRVNSDLFGDPPGHQENLGLDDAESKTWSEEESGALSTLLATESKNEVKSLLDRIQLEPDTRVGADKGNGWSPSLLQPIVDAILAADPSLCLHSIAQRAAVLACEGDSQIELEWRRNGEVRVFLVFQEPSLNDVLRHIGAQWLNLVVAIDGRGRYGIQRTVSAVAAPSAVAVTVLSDVQALEDAAVRAK